MFKEKIDIDTFRGIVGKYGADYTGQGLTEAVVQKMIDTHVKNKAHIFKLFGNKLKIEREVEVTVNESQARQIKNDLIEKFAYDKKLIFAYSFMKAISVDNLIKNTLSRDLKIFNVSFAKGTKISKALMKLVLPEDQHRVSTLHSMANQKLFTRGKVVLSIDPADYVTMSSNSSGWRSCHRLDGGEYRTGPLAYLNDSSTVICYIESSTPCDFRYNGKAFQHTNKVWRQIALVSPNLTFAAQERQYPNSNSTNQKAVSDIFKELFENFHEKSYIVNEDIDCEELMELHVDFANKVDRCSLYYNDTINEMYNSANVVSPSGVSIQELKKYELPVKGEDAYCLYCGDPIENSDSLYCYDCSEDQDDDDYDDDEW